jgi:tripartite-type tricarboxylate transporter receptor subunit TctC
MAGRVDVMFDNIPSALPHIKSGKLRALATTGARRAAILPELPTIAEQGLAGYEAGVWIGLLAPAHTPKPIIVLASVSNVLVVNPSMNVKSTKELIELAKTQPGKLTFVSAGVGTSVHMAGELFKKMAGVQMTHVPYKSSVAALVDLMAGRVDVMFDNIPSALPHIKSGKLRALATTGAKRAAILPELPTIAEQGLAGYEAGVWIGLLAPAGTPKPIVAKLNAAGQKAVKAPDFVKRMADLGYEVVGGTPEQMRAMIDNEVKIMHPIVQASGAKPE